MATQGDVRSVFNQLKQALDDDETVVLYETFQKQPWAYDKLKCFMYYVRLNEGGRSRNEIVSSHALTGERAANISILKILAIVRPLPGIKDHSSGGGFHVTPEEYHSAKGKYVLLAKDATAVHHGNSSELQVVDSETLEDIMDDPEWTVLGEVYRVRYKAPSLYNQTKIEELL